MRLEPGRQAGAQDIRLSRNRQKPFGSSFRVNSLRLQVDSWDESHPRQSRLKSSDRDQTDTRRRPQVWPGVAVVQCRSQCPTAFHGRSLLTAQAMLGETARGMTAIRARQIHRRSSDALASSDGRSSTKNRLRLAPAKPFARSPIEYERVEDRRAKPNQSAMSLKTTKTRDRRREHQG